MPQPIARRFAIRAAQLAIVAAGIFVIMMLFSRQAHASTLDTQSPLGSAPSSALSSVGSAVNAVAKPVTSATSAVNVGQQGGGSQSGSSGAGNQSSGGSGSSATAQKPTASAVPALPERRPLSQIPSRRGGQTPGPKNSSHGEQM